MINLQQDQQLVDEPTIKVAVPTGNYNETDLIECYVNGQDPNTPTCMYQAQYIALGKSIYHQSDELTEDQVAALLANTPADQVINNRKLIDGKRPAAKYIGRIVKRKGKAGKMQLRNDMAQNNDTQQVATTTEPVILDTSTTDQATSTPATTDVSTSTPTVNTATDNSISTSTPSILDNASSTPLDISSTTPDTASSTLDSNISSSTTDVSSTTPSINVSSSTPDTFDASSTPPDISSSTLDSNISSSTISNNFDQSSSTIPNIIPVNISSTTQTSTPMSTTTSTVVPPANTSSTSNSTTTSTTTDKLVSFAKKKLVDKLFNV